MLGWLCEEKITEAKIGSRRSKIIAFSTLAHFASKHFFSLQFFRGGGGGPPPAFAGVANRFPRVAGPKISFFSVLHLKKKKNKASTQVVETAWLNTPHTTLLHSEGSVLDSGLEFTFSEVRWHSRNRHVHHGVEEVGDSQDTLAGQSLEEGYE